MRGSKQYDETKALLNLVRENKTGRVKFMLTEEEQKKDAIAITNDPKFGENVLQNQINSFKQAVNGSAKFATPDENNPKNSPLVYFPKTGNVIFSGTIPALNGLKFQCVLNNSENGPFIFTDALCLTDENLTVLNKLRGWYLNFRDEFYAAGDLLDKIK